MGDFIDDQFLSLGFGLKFQPVFHPTYLVPIYTGEDYYSHRLSLHEITKKNKRKGFIY